MDESIEGHAPLSESGSRGSFGKTSQSTLSDVETEWNGLRPQIKVQESSTFERYLQLEEDMGCEGSDDVETSHELARDEKALVMSRIVSRLEDLKSRLEERNTHHVSFSRVFLQYSNEFMCSFDTKSSKGVRNVMARFGDHVAVGDSNGHVLTIQVSSHQVNLLKHSTGPTEDVGGVTALELVPYGKSLLLVSGHVSGVLRIWERRFNQSWSYLKDISGCHAATIASIGVVHVGMSMWLLSADTHGRLLSHNVQRFLSITAQALAGISRQLTGQSTSASYLNTIQIDGVEDIGVVLSMSGPYMHEGLSAPPDTSCAYMILCTEKGTLLVEIGQNGKVEYRYVLAGFDGKDRMGVYTAAWRRVGADDDADIVIAAISSGDEINTYMCRIPKKQRGSIKIDHIKRLACSGIVQGVAFIHDESVLVSVYFDGESGRTKMALIPDEQYTSGEDIVVESHDYIECVDTCDWIIPQPVDQLIAADLVWNGSLLGGPDVLLLTSSGIRCMQLLSWQQKLGLLVASKAYEDALLHVAKLYYSLQEVESRPHGNAWRSDRVEAHDLPAVSKQFASLLIMYLQVTLDAFRNSEASSDIGRVEQPDMTSIVHLAFDVCLVLDKLEMFYQDIASVLRQDHEDSNPWEIYIEVLEASIRQGLYSSKLPPDLIRMLVESLMSRSDTQSIEQLLLNLEISSLDLNQIIPLCIKHDLHSVILYVFSQGLKDYKSPAALLFASAVEQYMSSNGNSLAMKLMTYMYACFNGFQYPLRHRYRNTEQEQTMRLESVDFLLFSSLDQLLEVVHLWDSVANIQRDQKWVYFCEKYSKSPVLDFLFEIDVRQCLKLLQDLFSVWDALVVDIIQHRGDSQDRTNEDTLRTLSQATVDKLIETLKLGELSLNEVDAAKMDFILHHVASERASLPSEAAFSVLSYLSHTSKSNLESFMSSQKSFEDIVDHLNDLQDDRLMLMARTAGFSSAEAKIHRKRGHYLEGLECLAGSKYDTEKCFTYYRDVMTDLKIPENEKLDFQRLSLPFFPRMIEIDPDSTAEVALDFAGEEQHDLISMFDPESNALFLFLQALISKLKERSDLDGKKMVCEVTPECMLEISIISPFPVHV